MCCVLLCVCLNFIQFYSDVTKNVVLLEVRAAVCVYIYVYAHMEFMPSRAGTGPRYPVL